MLDPVHLTSDEIILLLAHKKKSLCNLISIKAHAILLFNKGYSSLQIADILFRSEKSIRVWIQDYHRERLASLFPHTLSNQNAAKLTRQQKQQLERVLKQPPSEYGIPKEFWDISSLKRYIKAEFGVEYESDESYRLILKFHNFSFHLPATFDIKRDEVLIERRMKEIKKEITPLLQDPSWLVFASDESRIIWESEIRRLWLPKGQKSVIKVHKERKAQSFLGLLNLKTGKELVYKLSWQNTSEIIKALEELTRTYPDKRICIIWDNAGFHKGKKLRQKLSTTLKNIHLINFPPYAPDKNPQEHVWKYGKDKLANNQRASLEETTQVFISIITGYTYPYQI